MIEIKNLKKSYGKKEVLHGLSLSLSNGIYGLLIVGLLRPTSGDVLIDGVNTQSRKAEHLKKLGYLPQYPEYYKNFTAREFLGYMSALKGIRGSNRAQIDELISFVNLSGDADRKLGGYSGGMLRRVGLAQALLGDPSVIILDEPTAGLDPLERISSTEGEAAMLKQELKKVFLKRKLLFLVLLAFALEAWIAIRATSAELPASEDREQYLSLVNEFHGELTSEKLARIETEKALFEEALYMMEEPARYERYLSGQEGSAAFFRDADYAGKTNSPIINGLAWRGLFGKPRQDLILAALMLVFVLVCEISETETRAILLRKSSVFGHKRLYRLDALIGVCLAITLVVLSGVMRYVIVCFSFGLSDRGTSITALSIFENAPHAFLSLIRGYLFTRALAAVGLSAFTALLFILGRLLRSSISTALFGVLAVLMPPYIFKAPLLYYISPVSLMQSTGFLIGDVTETVQNSEKIVLSAAAGRGSLEVSLAIAMILIVLSFVITGRKEAKG